MPLMNPVRCCPITPLAHLDNLLVFFGKDLEMHIQQTDG